MGFGGKTRSKGIREIIGGMPLEQRFWREKTGGGEDTFLTERKRVETRGKNQGRKLNGALVRRKFEDEIRSNGHVWGREGKSNWENPNEEIRRSNSSNLGRTWKDNQKQKC